MANEQNLKPPTTAEARSRGRKGGIASGKARKEKKAMKETLKTLLALTLDQRGVVDIEAIQDLTALDGGNITVQEAIMLKQIQKAMDGDTKAAEYVRDTAGEKPTDKVEMNSKIDIDEKINEIEEYMKRMDG